MSKVTLNELSKGLKDYIDSLGLTEEQAQYIIDEWVLTNNVDADSLESDDDTIVSAINSMNDDIENIDMSPYQEAESELLNTKAKSIVEAINEIFNQKDIIKQQLVAMLVSKGLSVTTDMSFSELMDIVDNSEKVGIQGTAVASDVLKGKTFINSTGQLITGTMVNQGSKSITPTANAQTLPAGYYTGVTISGDSNLKSSNIKYGVSIFGVSGSIRTEQTVTISGSGGYSRTVSHNLGKTPSSYSVTVSTFNVTWYATEATYYYTASGLPKTFTSSSTSVTISRGDHSTTANIRVSFTSSSVTVQFGHGLAQDDESSVTVSASVTMYR